jgi:hypothetical protein
MKKSFPSIIATLIVLLSLALSGTAGAAGLLIADGGFGGVLEIKEHEVEVTVNNGIAVTKVTPRPERGICRKFQHVDQWQGNDR